MLLIDFLNKFSVFCCLCFAATTTGRVFHMKLGSVGWKVVSYKAVLPLIIIFHCRSPVCTMVEISNFCPKNMSWMLLDLELNHFRVTAWLFQ